MTHGIGNILSRQLLQYFGSAETVFHEKRQLLEKVPGIGQGLSSEIKKSEALKRAEQELSFIEKNNISVFFFGEESYPARLKECPDAPLLFYFKGKFLFEHIEIFRNNEIIQEYEIQNEIQISPFI